MNKDGERKTFQMKRFVVKVAVASILTTVGAGSLSKVDSADAATRTVIKYTVTASGLHVRKGASTHYSIIGLVKRNQSLSVKQRLSNGWYKINYKGKTGYVSGQYVKRVTVTPSKSGTPTQLLNVPLIQQNPQLPSGCEVTALSMALAYYQVNVNKTKLAAEMPYDHTPIKTDSNGSIKTWGDPEVGFVGDPYNVGITINPNPLKEVLDKHRKGGIPLYGKNFSVIEDYVKKGKPTLVWFTITHEMPTHRTWETPKGKTIFAPRPLHCIVVTGVDSNYVYFNDSESSKGKNMKVSKNKFIEIYNAMGKRALVVN